MGVVRLLQARKQLFFAGLWLAVTLALVGVTQAVGVSQALGDFTPSDAATDLSTSGPDPAEEPYPSALYSGLMWSVTEARAIPSPELLVPATVEVDLIITNTLRATELRAPESLLSLVMLDDSDGTTGRFVDAPDRITIEPGAVAEVTATFNVGFAPDPDVSDLGLRISEPNRVPVTIPLDSPPPASPYPVLAAIDSSPVVLTDPDDAQRQIIIEPQAATIDINAGTFRAANGELLVIIDALVQRTSSTETSGFLDTDYWQILADGELVKPILVTRSGQPAANADEVTLLFSFPDEIDTLDLVAAPGTDESTSFPVVVPRDR